MLTGSTLCTPCAFLVFACLCPVWTLRCCSLLLKRGVGYGCRPVYLSGCCLAACVLAWLLLSMICMSLPKRVRFTLFLRLCLLFVVRVCLRTFARDFGLTLSHVCLRQSYCVRSSTRVPVFVTHASFCVNAGRELFSPCATMRQVKAPI